MTINAVFTPEQRQRIEKAAAFHGNTSLGAVLRILVDRYIDELLPAEGAR